MFDTKQLKPLKPKSTFKKEFVGFDIETAGDANEFVIACFSSDTERTICHSITEVIQYMENNKRKHKNRIYVATNLGFDFLGTFMDVVPEKIQIIERKGTIYACRYKYQYNNKTLNATFVDTLNYHKASVAQLGEYIKIPKLDHPACFTRHPKNYEEYQELKEYCMRDAYISAVFMERIVKPYLNKHKIPFKYTIGSLSMADFRTNYLKETLPLETEKARQIVFKGYYGGRVETFKRGKFRNVRCYDINSLYPSVMRKAYPDPRSSMVLNHVSREAILKYEGITYIEGYIPPMYASPLPYRKAEGGLIFPTGNIKGYHSHIEIREALNQGMQLKRTGEGVIYTKTINLFKEFVEDKYETRLQQKAKGDPLQLMTKIIMNSLYGKFAFNYSDTTQFVHIDQIKKDDLLNIEREIGENYFLVHRSSKPPLYSFPIFSAYATSYARLELYKYLNDPDIQPYICYCDTDSIFIDENKEIPQSSRFGDMGLEDGYPVQEATFVRAKFYNAAKPKIKGVSAVDMETFMHGLYGERIMRRQPIKFRAAMRRQIPINHNIDMPKDLNTEDTKRLWRHPFEPNNQQISIPHHI